MNNIRKLTSLIKNGETRKAIALLEEIQKETPCVRYAQAREKILLVEVSKELNNTLPHFYLDAQMLGERLFEENALSTKEAVGVIFKAVEISLKQDRTRTFEKAVSCISKEYCNNQLSLEKVSEYVGVSQSSLTKLFRENTGMTPGDYLGRLRVEKSLEYLRKNLTIEEAALNSGFSSPETYIRIFKKIMGITPGVWKRNNLFL